MPAPTAAPAHPSAAGALTIFLSSTIGDYEDYRREVQNVLLRKAECACFLSEDWIGGYDATVDKCRQRVCQSAGFILLLGHWYGSVPPGKEQSITHLEFDWARERWQGDPFPKMAVLKPKPGTPADDRLKEEALRILATREREERYLHAARLAKFHAEVDDRQTEWRTIRTFEDIHDLREYTLVIGRDWRGYTPMAAAQGQVDAGKGATDPRLRDDQLGRLGREPHHRAIRKLLSGLAAHPEVPAVALLVSGDRDAGQRAFVTHVQGSLLRNHRPKRKVGRLPPGSSTLPALLAWVAGTLGLTSARGVDTPAALADGVVEELKHQPLHFAIDRVGADYPGGIAGFQRDFWQPFWNRLQLLRTQRQIANRLVAIVTDYSSDAGNRAGVAVDAQSGKSADDFSRLVALPRLGPIDESDLYDWFDELEVPDDPPGRREELARRALRDEESGAFDGTPLHVFERLQGERLWSEGDD
ncbi:MAG: DUF4062 domain-containing protein [Candidatus Accumulibacter sp.]|nr:DUF4062 domain-containing protein [Accumulibacter sp.]